MGMAYVTSLKPLRAGCFFVFVCATYFHLNLSTSLEYISSDIRFFYAVIFYFYLYTFSDHAHRLTTLFDKSQSLIELAAL